MGLSRRVTQVACGAAAEGSASTGEVQHNTRGCMAKQGAIEMEGTVAEVLPNATFRVTVNGGHDVLTTLGGKMRQNRIRVLAGDHVTIEVSPYDLTRGRITYRHK